MKKSKSKILIIGVSSLLSLINTIQSKELSFYGGTELVLTKNKFQNNYGGNIYSSKFNPGINLFLGHMFNDHFGVELGAGINKNLAKTAKVDRGEFLYGLLNSGYPWLSFNNTLKQKDVYLAVVAKTKVTEKNYVSLTLGGSMSNIKNKAYNFSQPAGSIPNLEFNYSKTKLIPMIKANLEHKINDNFSAKLSASWKNTSKFKIKAKESLSSEIRLKDTFGLGIGLAYYI